MLKRDKNGFICQHDPNDPNYMDGGDTARITGLMALLDSMPDQLLLPQFEVSPGEYTRHPRQAPWNNPGNFTRDQLTCYVAGLWKAGRHDIAKRALYGVLKRGLRAQNVEKDYPGTKKTFPDGADFIGPDVLWHLILCAKAYHLYIFAPIGYFFQFLSLLYNVTLGADKEQNQFYCMARVSGLEKLYKALYPNFNKNMESYWGGWRDQMEVASEIQKRG